MLIIFIHWFMDNLQIWTCLSSTSSNSPFRCSQRHHKSHLFKFRFFPNECGEQIPNKTIGVDVDLYAILDIKFMRNVFNMYTVFFPDHQARSADPMWTLHLPKWFIRVQSLSIITLSKLRHSTFFNPHCAHQRNTKHESISVKHSIELHNEDNSTSSISIFSSPLGKVTTGDHITSSSTTELTIHQRMELLQKLFNQFRRFGMSLIRVHWSRWRPSSPPAARASIQNRLLDFG